MNMKQWVADVIRQREVTAIPVMTHPGIELNGNTVRQAVSSGDVHAKAVMTLAERYPCAAACTIMDLTTEAEAFGAEIAFSEEAVPAVVGHLLPDVESIYQLKVPSLSAARIPQYLRANLLAAKAFSDLQESVKAKNIRPLFSGCIGPFSLAGRLYDMSEIMVLIYENPDAAHTLLSKCTDFIEKYCQALKLTGTNGVVMAEPAAGQDDNFIVILHNCGNTGQCTKAMVETGAAAYHFGNKCRMEEVIGDVPPTALAMGNIDPVSVFKDGTADEMRQTVTHLLDSMKNHPNFVLSSGCDTPPHTPLTNIDAFFEALDAWNHS